MAEIMAEITFKVFCNDCGKELDAEMYGDDVYVLPCEICMEKSYNKGKEEQQ